MVHCYIVSLIHFKFPKQHYPLRFIGYNLSLLQHPFISAAKLQKNCYFANLVRFILRINIIVIFTILGHLEHFTQFPAEISFNI